MKVRDLLRQLSDDGWVQVRQKGSHRQLAHPRKTGLVTVSGHAADEVPKGTLNNILKQAGFK